MGDKNKTITARDLARHVGCERDFVLALFHHILDLFQKPSVDRIYIEGFGVFMKKIPPLGVVASPALPGGVAPRGGKPVIKFRISPKALEYVRANAKASGTVGPNPALLWGGNRAQKKQAEQEALDEELDLEDEGDEPEEEEA